MKLAYKVDNSSENYQKLREALRNKIKALDDVRQELHDSEIRFKDALSASGKKWRLAQYMISTFDVGPFASDNLPVYITFPYKYSFML